MNHAEQIVYDALKPLEGQGYRVFHSVRFVDDISRKKDYEADFVICGPQSFMVLEVKGGHIKWDRKQGTATSTDRNGKSYKIDPWKQGLENSYKILEHFNSFSSIRGKRQFIGHGFAAIFPDGKITFKSPTSLSGLQNTTWDRRHLDSLDQLVIHELQRYSSQAGVSDQINIDSVEWEEFYFENYDKSFKWEPARIIERKAALGIAAEDLKLSQTLAPSLAASAPLTRVLLEGGPGTGKTALLCQKALQAHSVKEESSMLYVCFNQMLSQEVEKFFRAHNVDVMVWEFHKLCEYLCEEVLEGDQLEHIPKNSEYYTQVLPRLTLEALQNADNLNLPTHIFVDEAQDLVHTEYWEVLHHLHSYPEHGFWWIAWDTEQCIFKSDLSHEEAIANLRDSFPDDLTRWPLSLNIRNHPKINSSLHESGIWHDESGLLHLDDSPTKNVQFVKSRPEPQFIIEALEGIQKEAKDLGLKSLRILSHHTEKNSVYGDMQFIETIKDIPFCTVQKFKGCECDGIILMDFDKKIRENKGSEKNRLYYLGLSRARLKVWVLG